MEVMVVIIIIKSPKEPLTSGNYTYTAGTIKSRLLKLEVMGEKKC